MGNTSAPLDANYKSQLSGISPGIGWAAQQLGLTQTDTQTGQLYAPDVSSPVDGFKATYSASTTALTALNGDVFTIIGSATKTIRITHIEISATGTAASIDVQLIKRSAADTGGTAGTVPTITPYDSTNPAVTAVVAIYTTAPTPGAAVGTIRTARLAISAIGTYYPALWDFGNRPSQAIVLRGVAQQLCINLSGGTSTAVDISIEWTEE